LAANRNYTSDFETSSLTLEISADFDGIAWKLPRDNVDIMRMLFDAYRSFLSYHQSDSKELKLVL
jgi:hypothetical protein